MIFQSKLDFHTRGIDSRKPSGNEGTEKGNVIKQKSREADVSLVNIREHVQIARSVPWLVLCRHAAKNAYIYFSFPKFEQLIIRTDVSLFLLSVAQNLSQFFLDYTIYFNGIWLQHVQHVERFHWTCWRDFLGKALKKSNPLQVRCHCSDSSLFASSHNMHS